MFFMEVTLEILKIFFFYWSCKYIGIALESHVDIQQCRCQCRLIFWQPLHFGAVVPFVDTSAFKPTFIVRSHQYANAEKALFPIKCPVITIALYLHSLHLCSFIFSCQIIFHSTACVARVKRTNLEDLNFTWNHEPK